MKDKQILLVGGTSESGKDHFTNYLGKHVSGVCRLQTSTLAKIAGANLGYQGAKTPQDRKFISDLYDMSKRLYDAPYRYLSREIEGLLSVRYDVVIVIHVREADDTVRLKKDYPWSKTVFIDRASQSEPSNHADANVGNYPYEYYILNRAGIKEFENNIDVFIHAGMA